MALDKESMGRHVDNKAFNFEFALKHNEVINLSKKDRARLEKVKAGEEAYDLQILKPDIKDMGLKSTAKDGSLEREQIGAVMRGGYS